MVKSVDFKCEKTVSVVDNYIWSEAEMYMVDTAG